jgi:hypothetical protein
MKQIMKKFVFVGLSLLYFSLHVVLAQTQASVSFTVSGTNPRCKSAFPNGAPYSGSANAPSAAAQLVDVTFQIQRETTPGTGDFSSFWGPSFVITGSGTGLSVGYSNNSTGATQLTLTPVNNIRMKATIRYRNTIGGSILTTIQYSSIVAYSHFPAPTANFNINNQAPPTPPIALNHYLCTGDAFMQPNGFVSGTGVQWRLMVFQSSASGNAGTPFDVNACSWRNGFPILLDIFEKSVLFG